MSKSEDYLDQLLKGINESEDSESDFEENFFGEDLLEEDTLEEDFFGEDISEDFLKEFEMELDGMEDTDAFVEDSSDMSGLETLLGMGEDVASEETEPVETEPVDAESVEELFDNLDSIISGSLDAVEETEESSEVSDADFSVEDFSYDDIGVDSLSSMQDIFTEAPEQEPIAEVAPQQDDGETDVMKILEGLGDLDLELDIDTNAGKEQTEESKANDEALLNFLAGSAMMDGLDGMAEEAEASAEDVTEETEPSKDGKKKKKDKKKSAKNDEKTGFMSKLGTILFGEDDEDEEPAKPVAEAPKAQDTSLEQEMKIQEFSDDTMDLFKDFTTAPSTPAVEEPAEPEDKKKKKKKEKVKKEKVKKEKKPKPKKEKKPKKPKEPDNTPPLPKKPVFLIFLMVGSLVALIMIGTDLFGYSNSMTNAKNAFAKKNYTEAYSYVSALEIKEKDLALFEKYETMALISSEYDAYKNLMAGEFYDMALDSLIRMVGRCEKYREDANIFECSKELNELESEAESILSETFKMTKEEALELYNYRDRRDYSRALNEILKELGMEKVIEE